MRVLVVGAASWNTLLHLPSLPEPHSHTLMADRTVETVGGTSAGKALNLAALGHEVHLHTLLGDDVEAARVREHLAAAGIHLHVDRSVTGTEQHVNLMARDGGRLSIYRSVLTPRPDLDLQPLVDLARTCDAVVLDIADYARGLIPLLAEVGIGFWSDLHDWDGQQSHHRDFAEAAQALVLSADALPDPGLLCRRLSGDGRLVVCTDGARGATAYVGEREVVVPAEPAPRVVDTNGAGDAFLTGLLHGSLLGWPLERSLHAGAVAGATVVGVDGLADPRLTAAVLERATAG
ncbi:MAG: PfkB family carbohydrate kinase [Nocardioidaceae bacterium]